MVRPICASPRSSVAGISGASSQDLAGRCRISHCWGRRIRILAIALPALQAQVAKPVISTATQGMAEAYVTLAGALTQPQQRFLRVTFLRFALQLRPDFTAARLLLASTQATGADPSAQPTNGQMENALATLQLVAKTDALYGPAASCRRPTCWQPRAGRRRLWRCWTG